MKQGDTNDRTTLISMTTRGEIRWSRMVSISFSACGTLHDVPMSYQGMKRTHDKNIMAYRCHWDTIRECQMMVTTKKTNCLTVDLSLVSVKHWRRSFLVNRTDRCRKSW